MAYQKTNIPGYVKDPVTKVIINRNTHEYDQYVAGRRKTLELNSLNKKVEDMGSELTEVKALLQKLLDKAS
jgi:hypothetical protein